LKIPDHSAILIGSILLLLLALMGALYIAGRMDGILTNPGAPRCSETCKELEKRVEALEARPYIILEDGAVGISEIVPDSR